MILLRNALFFIKMIFFAYENSAIFFTTILRRINLYQFKKNTFIVLSELHRGVN